jgi:hypothetical protein
MKITFSSVTAADIQSTTQRNITKVRKLRIQGTEFGYWRWTFNFHTLFFTDMLIESHFKVR